MAILILLMLVKVLRNISDKFTGLLKEHNIKISMDGKDSED